MAPKTGSRVRLAGVKMKADGVCDVCATAKQVRKTFKVNDADSEMSESDRSNTVVGSDVLGPIILRPSLDSSRL